MRVRLPGAMGGRVPLPTGRGGRMGLGGLLLLLLLAWLMGADPLALLAGRDLGGGSLQVPSGAPNPFDVAARQPGAAPQSDPEEEKLVEFVSFVLDDAQAVWAGLLSDYQDARLVLFRDAIDSACGFAQAAMGPFYCPRDHKVYIDLGFYEELRRRFGAPGDFAQAYVLAHEIGHHVQTLLGIESEIRMLQRARPHEAKALSVRMELQADCLAGVWAHSTVQRDLLERGDLEEGLAAASAVGDDRIQRMSGSRIQPEAFTHGSSRQRVAWFRRGFDAGDPKTCDTFSGAEP